MRWCSSICYFYDFHMKRATFFVLLSFAFLCCSKSKNGSGSGGSSAGPDSPPLAGTVAATDTLEVMAYNVLGYGNGCQGALDSLDGYFRTIVSYVQPDVLSCEKMSTFLLAPGSAGNLADHITDSVLNVSFPGRYGYAQPTNASGGGDMSVLFYNLKKLSFVSERTLVADVTDFNLYKFRYNDPNLGITHDTTFLYVVVNHTQSGSSSTTRDGQVGQEMTTLRTMFSNFPNLINMGDFNTANSYEAGYQSVITSTDSGTLLYDPPYYPDKVLQYPGNWSVTPYLVASFLTTTTRASATDPNSCGTGGGGKGWYDHLFVSPWLVSGSNYMKYIPNSYLTIGNDGNRLGVDITSTSPVVNASAPAAVLQALFEFSDKYPVTVKVLVQANRNGYSPADPGTF